MEWRIRQNQKKRNKRKEWEGKDKARISITVNITSNSMRRISARYEVIPYFDNLKKGNNLQVVTNSIIYRITTHMIQIIFEWHLYYLPNRHI